MKIIRFRVDAWQLLLQAIATAELPKARMYVEHAATEGERIRVDCSAEVAAELRDFFDRHAKMAESFRRDRDQAGNRVDDYAAAVHGLQDVDAARETAQRM